MKKLLAIFVFLIAFTGLAEAQCNGVFPATTFCGNSSGSNSIAHPIPFSAIPGLPGGVSGQIEYNNGGAFGGFTASGDATINTGTGVVTIQPNVLSNSKLAQMPATTIKCNATGSTANAADCTSTVLSGTYTSNFGGVGSGSAFLASNATSATYGWQVTGQPADQKVWDAFANGTNLVFRAVNDANNAATNWMTATRGTGATVSSVSLPETLNQSGGYAYLGQFNTGTGPIFPSTASGLALGWNFNIGDRDVDFFNADATPAATSFSFYQLTGASAATKLLSIKGNGYNIPTVLQGYADLRNFNALSCNVGAPTSTSVAQAAVNAYNAGWRRFFIPAGCFIYTGDTPWVATFGSNTIPAATYWRGEDWNTSGFSVCSTYTGCTPGGGTTLTGAGAFQFETLFTMDGACYNVDSSAFGHPAYCPVWNLMTNAGSFGASTTYPGLGLVLNIGAFTNGTWNGTDQPAIAVNNVTDGDGLFLHYTTSNTAAHFLNFFRGANTVATWNIDGKALFGNTSSSHASGMITITDSFGSCQMFTNTSGSPGFTCTSDRRLKDDIRDAPDHLAWLSSFRIRDFTMKSDGSKHNVGVIAQELAVNHPEMVIEGSDGYLQAMGPEPWKMMKAMQQMQAEIVELKKQLRSRNGR